MAITHSFLDSIPSIYLGAPDEAHALSVLPGHRLLNKGKGHAAIYYTLLGSALSLYISIIFFPFFLLGMSFLSPLITNIISYILIAVILFMIIREKSYEKKFWAFICFFLAGILGIFVFAIPNLSQPLFPLLSGLFGISTLLTSLSDSNTIPKQTLEIEQIPSNIKAKASLTSSFVGYIAAFLPGFGSSQAAIIAQQITGDIGDEGFLALVGGINTANMLISIGTAYQLSKARNGAILIVNKIIGEINTPHLLIFLCTCLIVCGIALRLGLFLSKTFSFFVQRVNYKIIVSSIIGFIILLTIVFDTWFGLIILVTSTFLGILVSKVGIGKNHLMGCLILPVILYFL